MIGKNVMENITKKNIFDYQHIYLECHNIAKNQHKFYRFNVLKPESLHFEVHYGKINGNSVTKDYHRHFLWKKYNEIINKGYRVIALQKFNLPILNLNFDSDSFIQKFMGEDYFLPEK